MAGVCVLLQGRRPAACTHVYCFCTLHTTQHAHCSFWLPACCRIQLCKGPPGSASEQQCTAVLRASPLLPPGISVPYTLGTAGVAAGPEAAEVQPQPMQL